ncbi:MAG: DUF1499 domain-containing protein [Oceanococcaceae bacterium]
MRRFLGVLALVLVLVVGYGAYATLTEPGHLYKAAGVFGGCPPRPSCVSSQVASDEAAYVAPLGPASIAAMARAIESLGGDIRTSQPDYLHAVFVTPTMRYRDDLEVLRDGSGWQVRSISRFGYRDFGVNAQRVESLRSALAAEAADAPSARPEPAGR